MVRRILSRVKKHGGTCELLLPPAAREHLQLFPGENVLMTLVEGAIVLVRFDADRQMPLGEARQLVAQVLRSQHAG